LAGRRSRVRQSEVGRVVSEVSRGRLTAFACNVAISG
jgi:hypothetical protein